MKILRSLLTLFTVLLLVGCKDTTGPDAKHVGTYRLDTVNGSKLPAVLVQLGADKLEITEASITLNADNSYTGQVTLRETEGGRTSTETSRESGTYTRNNNAITLSSDDGETQSASLSGRTLTMTLEGFVLVYKK
jgi:hypothetical protein